MYGYITLISSRSFPPVILMHRPIFAGQKRGRRRKEKKIKTHKRKGKSEKYILTSFSVYLSKSNIYITGELRKYAKRSKLDMIE